MAFAAIKTDYMSKESSVELMLRQYSTSFQLQNFIISLRIFNKFQKLYHCRNINE